MKKISALVPIYIFFLFSFGSLFSMPGPGYQNYANWKTIPDRSYYTLLGVSSDAEKEDIQRAIRKGLVHARRTGDSELSGVLSEASETLLNDEFRRSYTNALGTVDHDRAVQHIRKKEKEKFLKEEKEAEKQRKRERSKKYKKIKKSISGAAKEKTRKAISILKKAIKNLKSLSQEEVSPGSLRFYPQYNKDIIRAYISITRKYTMANRFESARQTIAEAHEEISRLEALTATETQGKEKREKIKELEKLKHELQIAELRIEVQEQRNLIKQRIADSANRNLDDAVAILTKAIEDLKKIGNKKIGPGKGNLFTFSVMRTMIQAYIILVERYLAANDLENARRSIRETYQNIDKISRTIRNSPQSEESKQKNLNELNRLRERLSSLENQIEQTERARAEAEEQAAAEAREKEEREQREAEERERQAREAARKAEAEARAAAESREKEEREQREAAERERQAREAAQRARAAAEAREKEERKQREAEERERQARETRLQIERERQERALRQSLVQLTLKLRQLRNYL